MLFNPPEFLRVFLPLALVATFVAAAAALHDAVVLGAVSAATAMDDPSSLDRTGRGREKR